MNSENRFIQYIKANKEKTILVCIMIILIIITATYAMFVTTKEGSMKQITIGNINVEYIDGEMIVADNSIPLLDNEIEEYAAKNTFSFRNIGNVTMYAEIMLTEIDIDNELKNSDFRWALYDGENEISNGNFADIKNNSITLKRGIKVLSGDNNTSNTYKILIWLHDNGYDQNKMLEKHLSAKITIKATDKTTEYVDNSGANVPELATGMIPVMYNEENDTWIVANVAKEWYNYNNGWWANAVTVNESSRSKYDNASPGTQISMDDINSMWVWIPRFKYKITSNLGSASAVASPESIDIKFESGLKTTGMDELTYRTTIENSQSMSDYYTHPAFRNGESAYNVVPYDIGGWDKELTGIWVGKFETSVTDNYPLIKPDQLVKSSQNISTMFKQSLIFTGGNFDETTGEVKYTGNNVYGLTSSSNTHMAKNTEWGAVVYLSQSKYGRMSNSNNEVYINNSHYSGRSAGSATGIVEGEGYGSYSYNNKSCTSEICDGDITLNAGTGASTTGNIYGIYDMNGGSSEKVMANWNNNSASSGFNNLPEGKYYDKYIIENPGDNSIIKEKSILGDATWETVNWYSDSGTFYNEDNPWIDRGGSSSNSNNSNIGIYQFNCNSGQSTVDNIYTTYRTVLIP